MPECGECNDAPAVTTRRFAGATVMALCEGCAAYWDANGLDEPVDDEDEEQRKRDIDEGRAPGALA